ncbi:MAG: phage tail tape measure protein [Bauldia sp.]|nr:phage tail tape measure protein [Bauldia sp.]
MTNLTSQLIVQLLDKVSGPARGVANSLRGISGAVRAANIAPLSFSDRLDAAITRNNHAIANARAGVMDAVGAFYVLKSAISAPIQAANALETALAELGAKANLSEDELRSVGEAAKTVGREVNQFTADIVRAEDFIVGMGLDLDRAARAMPAIGKAATATKADILDLSKAGYAAISNLGLAPEELSRAFDMMALAGKEGGFELKDMAQYLPAITGLAGSKGLTGARGLADIAAALQIVRRTAGDGSEAATNFSNILQKINANDAIKNFAKYGIDINAVLKDAVAEGASPLEAALRAIDQAIDGDLSKLGTLFADAQVQKGLIPLLQGMDDYIALREKVTAASGVIDADFERMMATSEEKLKSFQIAWANFQSTLGAALVPALNAVAAALLPLLESITRMIDQFPELTGGAFAAAAGFIALKGALSALSFVGLLGKGGLLAAVSAVRSLGVGLGAVAAVGAVPLAAVAAAVAAIGAAAIFIKNNWEGLKSFFAGFTEGFAVAFAPVGPIVEPIVELFRSLFIAINDLLGPINATSEEWRGWGRAAGEAVGGFLTMLVDLPRQVGTAISESVAVLTGFATAFFDAGGKLVQALGDGMLQVFAGLKAGLDQRIADILTAVTGIFGPGGFLGTLTDLPGKVGAAISGAVDIIARSTADFFTAGYNLIKALWDGMVQVFADLVAWIDGKIAEVLAPINDAAAAVKGFFGFGGGEGTATAKSNNGDLAQQLGIDALRAKGGPVSAGGSYLVGEEGPELITPSRSGYVHPSGTGLGSGQGITVAPVFHFNNTRAADADVVTAEVRRALRREVRELFRGVYADTGLRFA